MTPSRHRVAIVGAGPSGLYAACELLKQVPTLCVDMLDRLPTPGGLVRAGVSPDHASRRRLLDVYERLAISSGRYSFFGNVEVGRHLSPDDLLSHYSAVLYAKGALSERKLGIPGEQLAGVHSATKFVGWYNGHPDFADHEFELDAVKAMVVGNGNVALDVARMLLLDSAELAATDVATHALERLGTSKVRDVLVVGRRGPAEAAYTGSEFLELGRLADTDVHIESSDLDPQFPDHLAPHSLSFAQRLKLDLARTYSRQHSKSASKRLELGYYLSPVEFIGTDRVEGVRMMRNQLRIEGDGRIAAVSTGSTVDISAQLVFTSIGYLGNPIAGVPFDSERGTIPNERGRVLVTTESSASATPSGRTYVTGWIKRGPSGVIGTNKACAKETVATMLTDMASGVWETDGFEAARESQIGHFLRDRQPDLVDLRGWKAIDRIERERGTKTGRARSKLTSVTELLAAGKG